VSSISQSMRTGDYLRSLLAFKECCMSALLEFDFSGLFVGEENRCLNSFLRDEVKKLSNQLS
jgi:hypothetical protein